MTSASNASQAADPMPTTGQRGRRFAPANKRPLKVLIAIGLLLLVAGTVTWLRVRARPVTTSSVVRGTALDAVYATASVEALDRVTLKAKIAGSVAELRVREGETVKKGDLLAVLDSPALRFQLDRGKADQWAASQQAAVSSPQLAVIEAQAKMTEATLKNAREDSTRLDTLVKTGAAPTSELDRAKNQVTMLEAQLASQRAQARALKIDLTAKSAGSNAAVSELAARLSDTEVRAPIDGVVLARLVDPGEVVPVNGPLFRLGNVKNLVLECAVDEADIGRLSVGKKAAVSLYAFPKEVFGGETTEILPDADRAKKSFLVRVRLDAPPSGLRSGMSAEVNFVVDEHPNALLAPAESVDVTGAVWLVRGDRVERRTLRVGVRDLLRVEVLEGLGDGDHVVVGGAEGLKDGARVKTSYVAPNKNAPTPKSASGGGSL